MLVSWPPLYWTWPALPTPPAVPVATAPPPRLAWRRSCEGVWEEESGVEEAATESAGSADEWVAVTTDDGQRYFHNTVSGQTSWDAPEQ